MLMLGTLVMVLSGAVPAAADSAAVRELLHGSLDSSVVAPLVATKRSPSSAELKQMQRSIDKQELFRLAGRFGSFETHAGKVTATGFEAREASFAQPRRDSPRALRWDEIDRVDVKRSGTANGARNGMLVGCAVVVAAGAWAYYVNQQAGEDTAAPYLVALGAIPTIFVTTVIGGLIGGTHSQWEQVYPVHP